MISYFQLYYYLMDRGASSPPLFTVSAQKFIPTLHQFRISREVPSQIQKNQDLLLSLSPPHPCFSRLNPCPACLFLISTLMRELHGSFSETSIFSQDREPCGERERVCTLYDICFLVP